MCRCLPPLWRKGWGRDYGLMVGGPILVQKLMSSEWRPRRSRTTSNSEVRLSKHGRVRGVHVPFHPSETSYLFTSGVVGCG